MTTEQPTQQYHVKLIYSERFLSEELHNVIDWKIESDIYFFFLEVPGQLRPQIRTQWIKSPRLDSIVITPVGESVPYPPRPTE